MIEKTFQGVFAAAVTPLKQDFTPDIESVPTLLNFLAERGCHGALLLGTTGEGPSFSYSERAIIYQAATKVRDIHPDFRLLAGTGSPSIQDTIAYTRLAFDLGFDGVVVLPPYYYKNVPDEGLFGWFSKVIHEAVPSDGAFFCYHIPQISNVPISIDLLKRLRDKHPEKFAGLKNSAADPSHTEELGNEFGDELTIFTGNDRLFSLSLDAGASGCITAPANLFSPELRAVWDAYQNGELVQAAQNQVNSLRSILDRYPPAAPLLKALLAQRFGFPRWAVRQPLLGLSEDKEDQVIGELGWESKLISPRQNDR